MTHTGSFSFLSFLSFFLFLVFHRLTPSHQIGHMSNPVLGGSFKRKKDVFLTFY